MNIKANKKCIHMDTLGLIKFLCQIKNCKYRGRGFVPRECNAGKALSCGINSLAIF